MSPFFRFCRCAPLGDHAQGGPKIKIQHQGSIFFELAPVVGLTKYVSRRLTIYGNANSIFGCCYKCVICFERGLERPHDWGILDIPRCVKFMKFTSSVSSLLARMPHRSNVSVPRPHIRHTEGDTELIQLELAKSTEELTQMVSHPVLWHLIEAR